MDVNSEGIIDYSSIRYIESIVENNLKLSYQRADKMIKDAARREDEEVSSLQIDEGTEDESASTLLKWLDTIA